MKFALKLSAVLMGTVLSKLQSPCNANNIAVEEEKLPDASLLQEDKSKAAMNLRGGVVRATAHATTTTIELDSHDDQAARKLQTVTHLKSGVPLKIRLGGEITHFALRNVPDGAKVICNTTGGTDDLDLTTMKIGEKPVWGSYDCKSIADKGNEVSCSVGPIVTSNTTIYIDLYGYSGATLNCYTLKDLKKDDTLTVSGSAGSHKYYALLNVPDGRKVICNTTGGTGNVDLTMKIGEIPQANSYDCRSKNAANEEYCGVGPIVTSSTTVFLDLYGAADYSGAALTCTI